MLSRVPVTLAGVQILVVTTWFPSALDPGAGSFIARDVRALAVDHDVRVLHLAPQELDDGQREFLLDGVTIRRVPLDVRKPGHAMSAAKIAHEAAGEVDLVHSMAAPALLPFLLRRPRAPWVHTEHWSGVRGLATARGRSRLARPLARRAFGGPDRVVAVSEFLAAPLRTLRSKPVDVIGNIVDPVPRSTHSSTEPKSGRLRLLGVGSVRPNKGWELAIAALESLLARGVDAELTWLGGGAGLDDLRGRASGLPVSAPGHVSADRVLEEMFCADLLVLPTVSETFSLVTVEALAAGLPVVATGVGAHVDFLTPGTGLIVERDPGAIAEAAIAIHPADRDHVRRRGEQLQEQFSEQSFRTAYAEIYERAQSDR